MKVYKIFSAQRQEQTMKQYYIFIIFICFLSNAFSQELQTFTLKGSISGKLKIPYIRITSSYKDTSGLKIESDSVGIANNSFIFKGKISYPHEFHLWYEDDTNYVSTDIFFIEKGNQEITFNIDKINHKMPNVLGSSSQKIYLKYFYPYSFEKKSNILNKKCNQLYNQYNKKIPESISVQLDNEREQLYIERDSLLAQQSKKIKGSIVPAWLTLKYMHRKGYSHFYNDIINEVDEKYKKTAMIKYLIDKLVLSSETTLDSTFPNLTLLNASFQNQTLSYSARNRVYTLVDFWFSHCGPCIKQFNHLSKIYNKYAKVNFEIIGISVDKEINISDWQSVIDKFNLAWPQFIDLGGTEANKLSINSYPTNLLLDASGKIIAKNIQPYDLELFLEQHIK